MRGNGGCVKKLAHTEPPKCARRVCPNLIPASRWHPQPRSRTLSVNILCEHNSDGGGRRANDPPGKTTRAGRGLLHAIRGYAVRILHSPSGPESHQPETPTAQSRVRPVFAPAGEFPARKVRTTETQPPRSNLGRACPGPWVRPTPKSRTDVGYPGSKALPVDSSQQQKREIPEITPSSPLSTTVDSSAEARECQPPL